MLERSSATTCKSLDRGNFTSEEERQQLIVQGLKLEFKWKERLTKQTHLCLYVNWGEELLGS